MRHSGRVDQRIVRQLANVPVPYPLSDLEVLKMYQERIEVPMALAYVEVEEKNR